jgi:hypothetical protein
MPQSRPDDEGTTTMLKSLAIGLLTLTATVSTAAFAGTGSAPSGEGLLCYILPFLCAPQPGHGGGGGVTSAPEIDPESAAAALTLLAGGLAVLRARRAGKSEKKDS